MIAGIGTDIVDVSRVQRCIDQYGARFLRRILTAGEIEGMSRRPQPAPGVAARFAAKEATRKALGPGGPLSWHDVEVVRDPEGPVSLRLCGEAQRRADRLGVVRSHVSLSHERTYATAVVVLERE
jgi:holo-[acyl-carrier protein] synthase